MENIIQSSIYLLSCVIFMGVLLFVIDRFLTRKGHGLKYSFVFLGFYLILSIVLMPSDPTAPTFMTLFFVLIYTMIFYKEKFTQKILIFILSLISLSLIEILLKTGLTFLFKISYGALLSSNDLSYAYLNFVVEFLLIGLYLVLVRSKKIPLNIPIQSIPRPTQIAYTAILVFTFVYSILIDFQLEALQNFKNDSLSYFLIATLFMLIVLVISALIIVQINAQNDAHKRAKAIAELQLSYQLKHYSHLEAAMQETRKIKHDMKHHLLCLSHLLHESKLDDALNYIKDMDGRVLSINYAIETGNNIIDAILNEKRDVAYRANIALELSGVFPANLDHYIKSIDLCTIISNSLDNAIEATQTYSGEKNRQIEILSTYQHDTWLFSVQNPTNAITLQSNGRIATTKEDNKSHGFGLINIQETAAKYSGSADFTITGDLFTLDVVLQLEK